MMVNASSFRYRGEATKVISIVLLEIILAPMILTPAQAQSLRDAFKQVDASVVVVKTTQTEIAAGPERQPVSIPGLGSGVLISQEGDVMTAAHVVQTADRVFVEFSSGELIDAKIVGSEPAADVALLRLTRQPPPQAQVAKLGDSDLVDVGDQIFIIGTPLGLNHTLTAGHISARHKPNKMYSGMLLAEFFQTDAAINQGNSGGPMFNMAGEVVGIVSHIISRSGGFEGLGFAATSNMARGLLLDRKSFWSGLDGYFLSGELARVFNLPQPGGLLVQRVADNSPAALIGLRAGTMKATIEGENLIVGGDIVLEVQGIPFDRNTYRAIRDKLSELPTGEFISVTVLRGGEQVELRTIKTL